MSNSDFPRLRYSDVEEILVLDHSGPPGFSAAPDPQTAEADTTAQTSMLNVMGCKQVDVFIDVTNNAIANKLFVKVRFSGLTAPDVATFTDWGYVQIDNIDTATGISTVQEYMIEIDLITTNGIPNPNQFRRYLSRIQQVSGRFVSAIVWADAGGARGTVSFLRQGGSM